MPSLSAFDFSLTGPPSLPSSLPPSALHRVASKLGLKVEFFEGDLASPSHPSPLAASGQRQKGEMISVLAYVDGRPCSYGTAGKD